MFLFSVEQQKKSLQELERSENGFSADQQQQAGNENSPPCQGGNNESELQLNENMENINICHWNNDNKSFDNDVPTLCIPRVAHIASSTKFLHLYSTSS